MDKSSELQDKKTKMFPPIGELFRETWTAFKKSILFLIAFNVLAFVITIALYGVFFILLMLLGFGAALSIPSATKGGDLTGIIAVLGTFSIVIPVFVISILFIGSAIQAGTILITNKYKKEISFGEVLSRSIKLAIPLFLINFLLFVVGFGGFFVFIIPAIAFSLLFVFASLEAVFENKRWTNALRSSMAIVTSNLGEVFVRLILIWLLFIAIYIAENLLILPLMFIKDDGTAFVLNMIMSFIFWPINIILSWFAASYVVALYNQAKGAMDPNRKSSLKWVWIITIIGWIIAILVGIGSFMMISTLVKSDAFKKAFEPEKKYEKLTQFEAENLAIETFNEVNTVRKEKKLAILEENNKLCTYAQRRLDRFNKDGKYDEHQGFYEDMANQSIANAYFTGMGYISESVYYPLYTLTKAKNIVTYWGGDGSDKYLVNDARYSKGCVMANPAYMIIVVGEDKSQTGNNKSGYYSGKTIPTASYTYPTVAPGRPGSKEWDEEFWRKWDEMGKSNAESQKRVEESQKKFCEENPSLCN